MKIYNDTISAETPDAKRAAGSLHRDGSAAREYWLYVWNEHPWIKDGRPAEYSQRPVIIKARDLHEALDEAGKLSEGAAKWEMYEGSGWSGKSPVATMRPTIKPLNGKISHTADSQ